MLLIFKNCRLVQVFLDDHKIIKFALVFWGFKNHQKFDISRKNSILRKNYLESSNFLTKVLFTQKIFDVGLKNIIQKKEQIKNHLPNSCVRVQHFRHTDKLNFYLSEVT